MPNVAALNTDLIRDEQSGAILNTNVSNLSQYRANRISTEEHKNRFSRVESNLEDIYSEINSIKKSIKVLLSQI